MKRILLLFAIIGSGWCMSSALFAQQQLPSPAPAPQVRPAPVVAPTATIEEKFVPLTRGPVHEAFAQGVTLATNEGLITKKEPPPLIDEIPPAQRPADEQIAWIPGYWGWDDERDDFIWISGIWRAIPPGREWMPGYWARVPEGYQWISGYWADMKVTELEYLPPPPESLEAGPTMASPTGREIWIPGCWVWQQNKYVWRTGYWGQGDPRWVWTNSHYVYTPRGYLYVTGFWDYLPQQRGVLFAPVYFNAPVAANYVYSPRLVVNTSLLFDHLFLRPTYGHYYYGDYYAAPYRTRGILPYYVFNNKQHGFDSLYAYQRWHNRNDRNWELSLTNRYDALRDAEVGRPPRDYAAWERTHRADRVPLFSGIQDYSRGIGSSWKFRDLGDDHRRDVGRMTRDLDKYRQERLDAESRVAERSGKREGSDRVRLLKPPIGDQPQSRSSLNDREVLPGPAGRDDRPRLDREPRETPRITPRVNPPVPTPGTPRVDTPQPKAEPPQAAPMPTPRPEPRPGTKPEPRPQPSRP